MCKKDSEYFETKELGESSPVTLFPRKYGCDFCLNQQMWDIAENYRDDHRIERVLQARKRLDQDEYQVWYESFIKEYGADANWWDVVSGKTRKLSERK